MRQMRAVTLSLILAAAPGPAAPQGASRESARTPAPSPPPALVAPSPVGAPTQPIAPVPVTAPAVAPPAPVTAPTPVAPPAAAAPASPAGAAPTARPPTPAAPVQAVIDKLGQGDRAFLAGDYRSALFAYQDAVYMAPQNGAARVKLGRAYLALRYPLQALAQAEQALALDPASEDARRLAEEARNPPARPAAPPPAATVQVAPAAARPAASDAPAVSATQPRMYRFVPDADMPATAPQDAAARGPSAAAEPATAPTQHTVVVRIAGAAEGAPPADGGTSAPAPPTPGQRYRTALGYVQTREFQKAIDELSEAIRVDPRLAVAYAARASAEFGLGKYREASDDYRAAVSIDPNLGTPLYGLAECYRVLGDSAGAADMYQQYAESRAPDVREDLRRIAARRAQELR